MKLRIMLIEDLDDVREAFSLMLELHDCEVFAFADAESAISQIDAICPDAAIIDLKLNGLKTGMDVARQFRTSSCAQAKLAALTGTDTFEAQQAAARAGFDLFYAKPISIKVVHQGIVNLLGLDEKQENEFRAA